MIILYIILLLFLSIQSRTYETAEKIFPKIIENINKLSFNLIINGTNDYSYHLKSEDIIFIFDNIYLQEKNKEITFFNQRLKIIFNFTIHEYSPRIVDYSSEEVIYSETLTVDLIFSYLSFFREYDDFSFGFQYKIGDINKNILIHFENIDKLNPFNYLLFEDKNVIYENNTLFDYIKSNIIKSLENEIHKSLILYPECDSLNYFNSIINYCKNQIFFLDLRIYGIGYFFFTINRGKVLDFRQEEIIKENKTIKFKNISMTIFMEIYDMDPDDYDRENLSTETSSVIIDYISIDQNMKINYGKCIGSDNYPLDAFKLIVNKTIDSLYKKVST